jgi:DNA-binding response OmpR family regulator
MWSTAGGVVTAPSPEESTAAWDADGVRVLVVEDEVRQAAALKRGLEAEGFAVDVAANGTDGLWLATEQPYDVIVLDVMLPGLNGYKVCAELRAREIWTPVLMLTAKDGELDEAEALDTGADDFLSKPFSYLVLVARLRALLRRGGASRPAVLRVGALEVDLGAHRCSLDGALIDLTPREFAIVEYLMQRHGEVVPKAEILAHVWDFAFDGDDNVVEVHISALRRKLGPATIETVRGAGYRIAARGRG